MPYLQETGEVWDVLWPHNLSIFQGFLVAVRNIYKCSDCILESPTEGGATHAVTLLLRSFTVVSSFSVKVMEILELDLPHSRICSSSIGMNEIDNAILTLIRQAQVPCWPGVLPEWLCLMKFLSLTARWTYRSYTVAVPVSPQCMCQQVCVHEPQ